MARSGQTLFVRLMVAQAVTAVGLLLVFGALFYGERNRTLGRLVGERWAPVVVQAMGHDPMPEQAPALLRADVLPATAIQTHGVSLRVRELMSTLRARGVPVEDVAFSIGDARAITWLRVTGQPQWLGLNDALIEPRLPGRLLAAMALGLLLVAAVSAWLARRVAAPLDQLRRAMQAHQPEALPAPPPVPGAVAEVAAIDEAWRDLRARLAQHERERALLLAGVSHDLRSPLARIRMAAELLPSDQQSRREAITRNVDVADRLIASFLDHVRMGELPLNDTVDVAALARAVVAARPDESITLAAPASLLLPQANRLMLERVLQNLLDNACRHGRPPVGLSLEACAGSVCIEVRDQGTGLPAQDRDRLLQAFARGDAARSTPGTGLGLSVVHRAVARLGGELQFEHDGQCHRVVVRLSR